MFNIKGSSFLIILKNKIIFELYNTQFEHHTAEGIHGLQPVTGHQPVVLEEGQRLIMENGQRLVVENGQIIVENDEINEPLQVKK